jgi:hypothetical protein
MEGYVSTDTMTQKKAANNAFMHYIKPPSVVQACKVVVGFSHARKQYKLSWQAIHLPEDMLGCFKAFPQTTWPGAAPKCCLQQPLLETLLFPRKRLAGYCELIERIGRLRRRFLAGFFRPKQK